VGFVVGRAVGGSVERHRVVRRLRAVARERLGRLPAGSRLVVRALPAARNADWGQLARDLDAALDKLVNVGAAADRPVDPVSGSVDPVSGQAR
jgi:ribonuclease P protein component